jgi:adenylate cyclase
MIASQLESATRRVLSDLVVSEDTIRVTGRSYSGTTPLKIAIKGREKPLTAYGFASAPELAERDGDDQEPAPGIEASLALQEPVPGLEQVEAMEEGIEHEPEGIEHEPLSGSGSPVEEAAPAPQAAAKRSRRSNASKSNASKSEAGKSKAGKSTASENTKKSPI